MYTSTRLVASIVTVFAILGAQADALETEYVTEDEIAGPSEEGAWTFTGAVNGSANVASNRSVVGQLEGTGITVGLSLAGGIDYQGGPHEFRNTLNTSQTFSRTPVIDDFVKSADLLNFESIYYYHVPGADWFGPFGRVRLDTAVFQGFDVRPADVVYQINTIDGDPFQLQSDRLRLTDALNPLTMKQTVGAFARPLRETWMNVDYRLGFGARETLADGQLVLADDAATAAVVEVNELQNFNQAGAETTLALTGSFEESRVTYLVSAEALFPLVDSVGSDAGRSVIESTNVEFATQLGFALTDWASLNYQLLALRVPALVEDWQITNSLLLTMGGNWTKRVVTRTYDLPGIGDDATVPVPDAPVPDAAPEPEAAPAEEAAP